ncbi:MAG: fumarylacetoacetate hydrolase family protein [Gaiellaceae bacterium]
MFHPLDQPMERGWVGRIDGEHVVHLAGQTLQSFLTGGGREHAVYPLAGVRVLAPVLHPPAVRVFDDQTSFAFANPAAIVGPGSDVPGTEVLPRLAAVIGARGALGGFTVLADWRRPGSPPPKDRDFALGLGPVVVTRDELEPEGLAATVRVDGVERLRGGFDAFDWDAAHDHAAAGTRLRAGDLLAGPALGSAAVGQGIAVELVVDRIGVLAQTVAR